MQRVEGDIHHIDKDSRQQVEGKGPYIVQRFEGSRHGYPRPGVEIMFS
jgi:hypothetical protein